MEAEEEEIELFVWLPPDFPFDELYEIARLLTECDICVPGYIPPVAGLFEPKGFLYSSHVDKTRVVLLPDRNVASRFAQLAQGRAIRTDQQLRTAAALMAFCQCLDIQIEPAIAFHELAHRSGNDCALEELGWFRAADSADVHDLLRVALGTQDAVARTYSPCEVGHVDLALPLKRWRRNYVIALKVVELERMPLRPIDRFLALLDWMQTDFIFGGPAALLAAIYFAPNSPPRRRLFKSQNSYDREAAIAGIRNAAWDLTHLSDFIARVNQPLTQPQKTHYLFASFDINSRRIARLLVKHGSADTLSTTLESALAQWWTTADASVISTAIKESVARVRSVEWKPKEAPYPNFIASLIARGEELVRTQF